MRLFLVVFCVHTLAWTVSCASVDSATADWVLNIVCSNTTQPGDADAPPPCPENKKNVTEDPPLNLTPTGFNGTVDCTTRDHYAGVCVLYYQCNAKTKTVIEDGASILDVRLNNCPHYLEVCCRRSEIQDVSNQDDEKTPSKGESSADRHSTPDKAPDAPAPVSTTVAPTAKPNKRVNPYKNPNEDCGWSNPGVNVNIRSGEVGKTSPYANYGDFPFMVALIKKNDEGEEWSQADYLGGGTIIHPSVVITVAHKLSIRKKKLQPNQLKCRAGEWDTQTTLELFPFQERNVARYIIHENYYRVSVYNDIALLILEQPFDFANAPHMGIGCLPTAPPSPTDGCYSMGWGNEFFDSKKYATVMKKVQLSYVEPARCEALLKKSRLSSLFELHKSLMCANGEPGVDTCRGDGGSPLVCPISTKKGVQRFAVYGLVAYGLSCGNPNEPGLYANLPQLKSWVDEKMRQEGFDTKYYTI